MSIEGSVTAAANPDAIPGRADLLAGLESIPDTDVAPIEGASDANGQGTEAGQAAEGSESAEVEDPADDPGSTASTATVAPVADPELNKRLEAIQKADKRAKEAIAAQRAELEAERKKLEPDLAELNELRELRRRAKMGDSTALLKFGDYTEADALLVARSVHALSKEAAANPAAKEAVARALRERESTSKVDALEAKLADLQKQIADRDAAFEAKAQSETYLQGVTKVLDDSTPIIKQMFSKSPDKARQQVAMARDYLHQQTGEIPDAVDVLKALEDYERSELIARGFDPDSLLRTTKQPTPAAGEKPSAKTLSSDLTKSQSPRSAPLSPSEERASLLRALNAGQIDD